MLTVREPTTLVGVSELRTRLDDILAAARRGRVVLERRRRPVAVLVPIDRYEEMEALFESLGDKALGRLAKEREAKHKGPYLTIEEVERRIRKK